MQAIPKSERIRGTRCMACGREHAYDPQPYGCPDCGGILDVLWDDARLARVVTREALAARKWHDIWRYHELLPVESPAHRTPLRVGCTPLYEVRSLRRAFGFASLYVKDDGQNPTGSYKDRASAIGVGAALDAKSRIGACASTGNAASSFAGIGASLGLETVVFVPRNAPEAKVTQLLLFGARVFCVDGDYDETYDLCAQAIAEQGWYNRNAAVNPFLVEGKTTAAFEIAEELGFDPPDVCIVAVGDGCTLGSLYKGFEQFRALGLIARVPRLIGVQAVRADPLVRAFASGAPPVPMRAASYADSINVGKPRNALKALEAVRASRGSFLSVEDEAIREAQRCLSRQAGIFGEPAGVASFAGLLAARSKQLVDPNERIVVLVTGNGLKDVDGARSAAGHATQVGPRMQDLRLHLQRA